MDFDKVAFCDRLLIARTQAELKQKHVAKKLGINQSSYSAYETGKTDMTVDLAFKLASIYDVSIYWLLGLSNNSLTAKESLHLEQYANYLKSMRKRK